MADRYQAEDRWMMLHPLTTEVYAGASLQRDDMALPDHPVEVYATQWTRPLVDADPLSRILCRRVTIKKRLEESLLARSLQQLIRHQEMIQMSLHEGKYVPAPVGDEQLESDLIIVYEAETDEEVENLAKQCVERLAAVMRPERDFSLRLVQINRKDACDLFILTHRAIVDDRGLVLLCEDLFRIYEQLSNGKRLVLRPVNKTYAAFIKEGIELVDSGINDSNAQQETHRSIAEVTSLMLDQSLSRRMFTETLSVYGVTPAAVIFCALARCFKQIRHEQTINVDLMYDNRLSEPSLHYTVGALTKAEPLFWKTIEGVDTARQAQEFLARSLSDRKFNDVAHPITRGEVRVLWNLEHFIDEPWLGGDEWSSQEFVVGESLLSGTYLIEIEPHLSCKEIKLLIKYHDALGMPELVECFTEMFSESFAAVLDYCEDYVAAEKFWLGEYGKWAPRANFEFEEKVAHEECALVNLVIEDGLIRRLQTAFDTRLEAITLAAYSVLVSLLSGREETLFIAVLDEPNVGSLPLKLYPLGDLTFVDFAKRVEKKLFLAAKHESYTPEILSGKLFGPPGGSSPDVFDVGYVFSGPRSQRTANSDWIRALRQYQTADQALALILHAMEVDAGLKLQLIAQPYLVGQDAPQTLISYLQDILDQIVANTQIRLADISLGQKTKGAVASEVLASDTFYF
jgi:hypothetical protein